MKRRNFYIQNTLGVRKKLPKFRRKNASNSSSHKHNATFFQQNEMLCMESSHKSTSQNESYKQMSLKTKGNWQIAQQLIISPQSD